MFSLVDSIQERSVIRDHAVGFRSVIWLMNTI